MSSELLKVAEVAALLKVSTRQIWKLAASGRLPTPVRLGRSVRWRAADIDAFVERGCDMQTFDEVPASDGVREGVLV